LPLLYQKNENALGKHARNEAVGNEQKEVISHDKRQSMAFISDGFTNK